VWGLAGQVKGAMEMLGIKVTEKEVREMVMEYDSDGSGQIELDEFMMVRARASFSCSQCELQRSIHPSLRSLHPPPSIGPSLPQSRYLDAVGSSALCSHACTTHGTRDTGGGGG
jgi:hypothetical protein